MGSLYVNWETMAFCTCEVDKTAFSCYGLGLMRYLNGSKQCVDPLFVCWERQRMQHGTSQAAAILTNPHSCTL